jgi:HPt (histidine-containing phosphotransfer) domain-containing protein
MSHLRMDDPAILDPAHLVAALGSSPRAALRPLCDLFVGEMYSRLDALKAAIAGGEEEQIEFLAHALRGSAANFGAMRLMELGDPTQMAKGESWLRALEAEIVQVDHALSALLVQSA